MQFQGRQTDARSLATLARAVEAGRPFVGELRAQRGDGMEFWAELTVRCVRDDAGKPEQFIATVDDITDKVRQQHIIFAQSQFIGDQAKLTADSAFGAARSLTAARAMIASQGAENATLNETIKRLEDELARQALNEEARRKAAGHRAERALSYGSSADSVESGS